MKNELSIAPTTRRLFPQKLATILGLSFLIGPSARAGDGTWIGTSNALWTATGSWSGGTVAGAVSPSTTDTGTATFNSSTGVTITVDSGRNVKNITFTGAVGAFTLSGGSLALTNGGTLQLDASVLSSGRTETIGSPIALQGNYAFVNNATTTDQLSIGAVTNGQANTAATLSLDGINTRSNAITGIISDGAGTSTTSISKSGAGIWVLSGANTYTGGTTLNAGTLSLGNAKALGGNSSALTINGGNLDTSVNTTLTTTNPENWNGDFTFAGSHNLNLGAGAVTLGGNRIVTVNAGLLTVGGAIGDGGNGYSLTKSGAGALTLANANTYGGGTILNAGTLNLTNANALGSGAFTINGGSLGSSTATIANAVSVAGDFAVDAGGTPTLSGSVTLTGTGAFRAITAGSGGTPAGLTISGVISEAGAGNGLTITGDSLSTVTLSGANTFTGGVNLNGAVLVVSSTEVPGTSGALGQSGTIGFGGGTLRFTSADTFDFSSRFSTAANQAFKIDTNNQTVTLGGNLASAGGTLTKLGGGTLVLSGANTFTGATNINAGKLSVATLNSVSGGVSGSNLGAPTTVADGTISLGATTNSGSLLDTGTGETTDRVINLAGTTSGGVIDQSGTGLLKFTSAFTATGAGAKSLTLQGSTVGTGEISGAIVDSGSGATSLIKAGTGTWTLSGSSTYSGPTTIQGGVLAINSIAAVGGGVSAIGAPTTAINGTIGIGSATSAGTLVYTGAGATTDRIVNLAGTTGGATLDQSGTGLLKFTSSFTATGSGSKVLTLQGSTTGRGEIDGAIINNSVSNKTSVVKAGSGAWTLAGANTYSGTTTVNGGTLGFANTGALYNGTTGSWTATNVTVGSGATLAVNVGGAGEFATTDVATLLNSSHLGVATATTGFQSGSAIGFDTTNATGGNFTPTNVIADTTGTVHSIGVTKLGTGSLTLSNANTYSGGTTVLAGALYVSNTSGSGTGTGALNVASGATFGGTGTANTSSFAIAGTVQVGNGTDVSSQLTLKGAAASTFTNASLTFNLDKTTAGASNTLNVANTSILFATTTLTLNLQGSNPTIDNIYTLFAGASGVGYSGFTTFLNSHGQLQIVRSGNLDFLYLNPIDNSLLSGSYLFLNGNDIDIEVVPEPETWAMMLAGVAGLVFWQRQRNRPS